MGIEAIWDDLLASLEPVESPRWHLKALEETEARVTAGWRSHLTGNKRKPNSEKSSNEPSSPPRRTGGSCHGAQFLRWAQKMKIFNA
jgi:hypothetical protein